MHKKPEDVAFRGPPGARYWECQSLWATEFALPRQQCASCHVVYANDSDLPIATVTIALLFTGRGLH
jgi:hypothetical protein